MYLSKLTLDPHHAQAQVDLASPYELHRTLARAFPDPSPERHRARHGVLFRVEDAARGGVAVLVQSTTAPDWGRLLAGYAPHVEGPKPFEPAFAPGQLLRFRLVANPVRRTRLEGKKHPRRCALVHPHAKEGIVTGYLDWLGRQGEAGGFAVEGVVDAPFRLGPKWRVERDPERIVAIPKEKLAPFGVRFDGRLRVTDPERLLAAVRAGIGPAKAYGFGLLSLAPAG